MEPTVAQSPTQYAIGVEIGTRGLRAVICDSHGRTSDNIHAIHTPPTAQSAVHAVSGLIEQLLDRQGPDAPPIQGIGIAFGGPVDTTRGITIGAPRIHGFENFPLAGIIEDRFNVPTVVENDGRAAALGEYRFGAGRGSRSMLYMQLGIGIGGGVVINGRLHHGAAMTAGEFGHMPVTTDGPRCSCGKPGHLEAYISETILVERLREALRDAPPEIAAFWRAKDAITARDIFLQMDADPLAQEITDEALRMIGLAVSALVSALSFDSVVFGGYALDLGARFVGQVRTRIRQHAFEEAGRRVIVSVGQLGTNAAVIGATAAVFQRLQLADEATL